MSRSSRSNCDGDKAGCPWGSCFECDFTRRVWVSAATGKRIAAKMRKGDTEGTWIYLLDGEIHSCTEVDREGRPECAQMNAKAVGLIS